ncbi:ABC transporter ATP-binding protein [Magnetospirillum sp. 64-120]|uniref:ABC transporter ATP-binding protein n=1 Tax=Magnetospirillum sp. 64-120 TaxID=1895778 RepID=UPI0009266DB4|nr:ABC transporter ATP-binding protein [Magnetospirillum sp. 64-120]OJX68045.1 MAG: ABC transporter ATP-binding protein [Magnetospirillum sp. 64-120]
MTEPLLHTKGLVKRFGGVVATNHVDLQVERGHLHALIGPNGAGKSTLIGQLSGEMAPDAGRIHFDGHDVTGLHVHRRARLGLARSFQITSIFKTFSVLANVTLAVQAHQGHSFRFWRPALGDTALTGPALSALERVGLADRARDPASALSHGERRQLELAMALAGDPVMLLLDEPMAGMGPDDGLRMVELLASLKGERTILLVEHDMDAVFQLADRISVLVYGAVIASGTPDAIRADEQVRQAYLGEDR